MHGLDTATIAKVELLEAIEDVLLQPRKLDYKIQFTGPTGTNAVEAAIKLARKTKQRSHIVAFTNAYHGHSLGSLALTGSQYYHDLSYGSHNNVSHLPYDGYLGNCDTSFILEKMLDDGSGFLTCRGNLGNCPSRRGNKCSEYGLVAAGSSNLRTPRHSAHH
jgi:diaminobutyrate-2-oxoglutarate transaminase